MKELQPSVFFIEETKLKDAGRIKLKDYVIFEKPRTNNICGGGIAIGCIKELNPVWVNEGQNDVEALTINIFIRNMKIRCCVAYGFQENQENEKKDSFWNYLDNEVIEAKKSGAGLIIQFDGNLWAGRKIVPNDPRVQNKNGKLFQQFLDKNSHLTVVNSLELCEGLITRRRIKNGKLEESVLDFFLVCNQVLPHVKRMVIDEDKKYILTNYEQIRRGGKASDSDHNTLFMDLNLKILAAKPVRREIWNFKNKQSQEKFKQETSKTRDFTNCFQNDLDVEKQVENWKNLLISTCNKTFKKVRITKSRPSKSITPQASELIDVRNKLSNTEGNEEKVKLLNEKIADIEAEMNRNEIFKNFQEMSQNPENINLGSVWKLLNRMWPKCANSLPTSKINHEGIIISAPEGIKKLLGKRIQRTFENKAYEV